MNGPAERDPTPPPDHETVPGPPTPAFGQPIPNDTRCVRCRYNLRGLMPAGYCPECGTSIARTLSNDSLGFADSRWLIWVCRGCLVMAVAGWIAIGLGLTGGLIACAREFGGVQTLGRASTRVWPVELYRVAVAVGSVGLAAGLWLMTTPQPQRAAAGQVARVLARWLGVTALLLTLVERLWPLLARSPLMPEIMDDAAIPVFILLTLPGPGGLAAMFALARYQGALFRRADEHGLHRRQAFFSWLLALSWLPFAFFGLVVFTSVHLHRSDLACGVGLMFVYPCLLGWLLIGTPALLRRCLLPFARARRSAAASG